MIRQIRVRRVLPALILLLYPVALTWPLAAHLLSAIPQGSESVATVPLFNLWTMGWNVRQIVQGFPGYWDAPIFWPEHTAFAYSDPQPLTGWLALPAWFLSPAMAYNLVLWLFLSLNGWSVFRILRRQGLDTAPAVITGLLAQSLPYLTHERGVLQLQPFFGMIWTIDSMWCLLRGEGSRRDAFQLALGLSTTFLTSSYYGLFLLILLPPFLVGLRFHAVPWMRLLTGGVMGVLLPLPYLLRQRAILQSMGFSRSLTSVSRSSACLGDYLRLTPLAEFHEVWGSLPTCGSYLFPGLGLVFLGVIGLAFALRGRHRIWGLAFLLSGLLAFALSSGPGLEFANWQPFLTLREFVPGFDNLRSPFRFGMWVQLVLALFSGIALQALWNWRKPAVLLGILTLVELFPQPAVLTRVPDQLPPGSVPGATLYLPFVDGSSASAYEETVIFMWQALPTEAHLVNGYSGYFPPLNSRLKDLLIAFPDQQSLDVLQDVGIEHICWRSNWPAGEQRVRLQVWLEEEHLTATSVWEDVTCYPAPGP